MRRARLALALLLLLSRSVAASPDVLLVTLDTTRADALGCYGAPEPATPALDRLSRAALLVEDAQSSAPMTLPAHATLLTGRYPPRTGVRDNGIHRLPADVPTLASCLAARGYEPAALLAASVLDRAFGLARGFASYDDDVRAPGREERDGAAMGDLAVARLREIRRPYLLWLHLYDPHAPYAPPPPFAHLFGDEQRSRYLGEVAAADHAAARALRAAARRSGKELVIAVAGDHGEGLGDHGEDTHGVLLNDAMTRVPLLLSGAGIAPRVEPGVAGLVDVLATLLDALGVPPPDGMDGGSLLDPREPARIYAETELPRNSFGWSALAALRTDRYTLIRGRRSELYDRSEDPGEGKDVARSRAADRQQLEKELLRVVPRAPATPAAASVPEDLRASLASLGYVSAPGAGQKEGELEPREGLPLLRELTAARALMEGGEMAKAAPMLERIVAKDPGNVPARTDLATCYQRLGRLDDALAELGEALARRDLDFLHLDLGKTFAAAGRLDDARRSFRAALARNPRLGEAYADLAGLEIVAGRVPEARKVIAEAFAAGVREERVLLHAGRLAAAGGDLPGAMALFAEAAARPGASGMPRAELGRGHFLSGRIDDALRELEAASRIEPENVDVHKSLASIYLEKKGDRAAARRHFEAVLRIAPGDPDAGEIRKLLAGL